MKEPFTPLGEDLIKISIKKIAKTFNKNDELLWYNVIGGRIFFDISKFLSNKKILNKFKKTDPNDKDPITTKILLEVFQKNKKELLSKKEKINFIRLINLKFFKFLFSSSIKCLYGIFSAKKARKKSQETSKKAIENLKKQSMNLKTKKEKIDFIKNNINYLFLMGTNTLLYVLVSSNYIVKAKEQIQKHIGQVDELKLVEKSIPHSITTQMGLDLLNIAKKYDLQNKKPKLDDLLIQKFLKKYGHKKTIELDIGTPVWEEEPKYILDLISMYMENKIYEKKLIEFNENQEKANQAIEKIKQKFIEKKKGEKTAKMLYAFREMFGMREQSKFTITQGLYIFRKLMQEIGDELVNENKIDNKNDIFFLLFDDILSNKNLKEIIKKNKEEYYLNLKLNAPRVLLSTGESLYWPTVEKKEGELKGIPISPGIVKGKVRILNNPEEGHKLKDKEILVTTGTNPAWTPLFLKISGLVMETGGSISHGSVVAREYNLPAISAIENATKKLKDGQTIQINGETGIINILK